MPDALTLVIAVYNEADTLPLLQPRIAQVLDGLRQDRVDGRILYVDDGSTRCQLVGVASNRVARRRVVAAAVVAQLSARKRR
jgi:hypothetical protein